MASPSSGVIAFGDQKFAGGDEIVEHVLLVRAASGIVPCLAVFAAAADVGEREGAARLHPCHAAGGEAGRQRDVEAAIAIQQRRHGLAAGSHIGAAHDEHGHAGAVLALVEALLDHEIVGIEGEFGLCEHRGCRRVATS